MFDNLDLERKSIAGRFPDSWACKSEKQIKLEKQGCAPACVVNVVTKKAEINWRCTGLLPE